jgi:uncharacterized protein YndB with AHSA1/START domain
MTSTDRIEKQVVLHASKGRVYRALTDAAEFGAWFGLKLEGPFKAGGSVRGKLTIPKYEHMELELKIEKMKPEDFFSYRWHPYAIDPAVDYAKEPTTLVEFRLEETKEGTMLTVVESGFDKIPAARRAEAFRMNDKGWSGQLENVRRYVEK